MFRMTSLAPMIVLLAMAAGIATPLAAAPVTPSKPGNNPTTQKGKIYQVGKEWGTFGYTDFEDVKQEQKVQEQQDYAAAKIISDRTWLEKKRAKLDAGTEVAVMEIKRAGKVGIWCRVKLRSGEEFWVKDRDLVKNGSMAVSTQKPRMYESAAEKEARKAPDTPGIVVKDALAWKDGEVMNKLLSTLGLERPGASFEREHENMMMREWDIKFQVERAGRVIDGVLDQGRVDGVDGEQIKYLHDTLIPKAEESGAVRKLAAREKVSIIQQYDDDTDYGKITKIKTSDGKIWLVRTRDVVKDVSF